VRSPATNSPAPDRCRGGHPPLPPPRRGGLDRDHLGEFLGAVTDDSLFAFWWLDLTVDGDSGTAFYLLPPEPAIRRLKWPVAGAGRPAATD
jgi:hypothetical protein